MHVMTSKASVDFLQHLFSKAALGALLEVVHNIMFCLYNFFNSIMVYASFSFFYDLID